MKRKSILLLTAALALSAAALVGCGTPQPADPSAVTSEISSGTVAPAETTVAGTWILREETIGEEPIDLTGMESVYVFDTDGTFAMLLNGDDMGSGTYTTDGDTVTIDLDGAQTPLTLEDGTLRMETDTPDGKAVMLYQRAQQ